MLAATLDALRQKDAETDAQVVDRLFEAVRGSDLGVLGAEDTLAALQLGQVDELVITARPDILTNVDHLATPTPAVAPTPTGNVAEGLAAVEAAAAVAEEAAPPAEPVPAPEKVADQLVTLARQTSATRALHRGAGAARRSRRRGGVPRFRSSLRSPLTVCSRPVRPSTSAARIRSDMSKHNNANWDHYKVAGREHPGDDVHHDEERQQFSGAKAHAEQAEPARPAHPQPGARLAARAGRERGEADRGGRRATRRTSAGPKRSSPR